VSPLLTLLSFALRVSFGFAVAMAITPPRWVGSGFYRVHLWVLLGVFTLAALVVLSVKGSPDSAVEFFGDSAASASAPESADAEEGSESSDAPLARQPASSVKTPNPSKAPWYILSLQEMLVYYDPWIAGVVLLSLVIAAAVLSYVGSVVWLYEEATLGRWIIVAIAALALVAALLLPDAKRPAAAFALLPALDVISSGLLAGVILAAMLLGHWYLNAPNMNLAPLKRLVLLAIAMVVVRAAVSGTGLAVEFASMPTSVTQLGLTWWLLVTLRWVAGLLLTLVLTVLAWQTLKIPNTQSATGILYAAVAVCFLGELTEMLLAT